MLMGSYQNSIDAKNRIIVPAKFREDLGSSCVLTVGLDDCLIIYPMSTWEVQQQKLAALPRSDENARAFIRYVYANATECDVDKQGRILIPASYKDKARFKKDLVTIGLLDRVEIWSREVYDGSDNGGKLGPEGLVEFTNKFQV